jgi:stage II sporulation protein D
MRKTAKIILTLLLTFALILTTYIGYPKAQAYTPPYTTIRVGLYYGSNALPSANLQNVSGYGSGYQFGLLDEGRNFIPIGASTSETKITVLRDRNMVYNSSQNRYDPGSSGSVVVGCYHIQLDSPFSTYADAAAAVAGYGSGFVKYSNGSFFGMIGNYLTSEEATAAIGSNGIAGCSVNSGTSYTMAVVATGTNRILFEFDYGASYYLTVMPLSQGGEKCVTWFKGYRYYGAFQYHRENGGDLIVYNAVDIEDYVKGVIPWEMSPSWPLEALKAQAVCARTYAIASHKHSGFDVCTTEDCQVYQGIGRANATTDAAVDQTAGQYMTCNGELCIAYYSSCDGGATENSENVWNEAIGYLRGVIDPYEADIADTAPDYRWTVTYTPSQLTTRLRNKGYNVGTIVSMTVSEYTAVGNVFKVSLLDSNGVTWSFKKGEQLRSVLGVSSIRFTLNGASPDTYYINGSGSTITGGLDNVYAVGGSGNAEILGHNNVYAITGTGDVVEVGNGTQQTSSDKFVMTGAGRGHNVGMSQWGAYSMAKHHNMTYNQILQFYFTGVTIG